MRWDGAACFNGKNVYFELHSLGYRKLVELFAKNILSSSRSILRAHINYMASYSISECKYGNKTPGALSYYFSLNVTIVGNYGYFWKVRTKHEWLSIPCFRKSII